MASECAQFQSSTILNNYEFKPYKRTLIRKSEMDIQRKSVVSEQLIVRIPISENHVDTIDINGQVFNIEKENEFIYLTHDKWSLVGMGKTFYEAEIDLLNEAKELFNDLQKMRVDELSLDALQMRDFLFGLV